MRLPLIITLTSLCLAACGGDDGGTTPDASVDIGFNLPTVTLKANEEVAADDGHRVARRHHRDVEAERGAESRTDGHE